MPTIVSMYSKKKTWLAIILNFFIWGVGYIYLRKKVGYGIFLLLMELVSVGILFSNLQLAYDLYFNIISLVISTLLALDIYFLSSKNKASISKTTRVMAAILALCYIILLLLFSSLPKTNQVSENLQSETKVIKIYIDKLPYGVDKKYENSIREAMSFWEKNVNANFKEVSTLAESDVYVKWIKEFGTGALGHALNKKYIDIGLGSSDCLQKWRPYTYNTILLIAKHELGHALGAEDDYENSDRIMYYQISTKYEIDIEEEDVLPDDWTKFYPVCTKNNFAIYSFKITSTESLDVYVVPSREDYELFTKGKQSRHYADCQGEEVKFYQENCIVPKGGGIILKNPSGLFVGNSAQFKVEIKEI